MLTEEYKDNIFVCFTHVTSPLEVDARELLVKMDIPLTKSFYFDNLCLVPFDLLKSSMNGHDKKEFEDEVETHSKTWKRNKKYFDSLISALQEIRPCSPLPMVLLYHKRRLIEYLIVSYINSESNAETYKESIQQSQKQLKSTNDLIRANSNYTQTQSQKKTVIQRKKFLWLIPYIKKVKVNVEVQLIDQKKYQTYQSNLETQSRLKEELSELEKEHEAYSNDLQFIKGPILYVEEMIKNRAMNGYYRNIHTKEVIQDLIDKLKTNGERDSSKTEEQIAELSETLTNLERVNKVFDSIKGEIQPFALQVIIHMCEYFLDKDSDVPDGRKEQCFKLTRLMRQQFNPKTKQELDQLGDDFEKKLDQFLATAYFEQENR